MRKLFEFSFIIWSTLKLLTGIDLLVIDHRNHDDVHATINGAQNLLPLLVVRLVDVMRTLIEINSFELGYVVIETWKNDIGHDLVGEACLPNIFDSYGAWNLFVLEVFGELFVGHSVFLCFAKAVKLLQSLPGVSQQLWAHVSINFMVFA